MIEGIPGRHRITVAADKGVALLSSAMLSGGLHHRYDRIAA